MIVSLLAKAFKPGSSFGSKFTNFECLA